MLTLSIIICVAIAAGFILGYRRGIVRQIGSLVSVFVALIVSRMFGGAFTTAVARFMGVSDSPLAQPLASCVAHVVLFLVAWLGVWLFARTIHELVKAANLGCVNSLAGGLFMGFKVALVASMFLNLWALSGEDAAQPSAGGPLMEAVASVAPAVLGYIQGNF